MKKIILFFVCFFMLSIDSNALIDSADISISLKKDGSCLIEEKINMNGTRELEYDNMIVSNITVNDEKHDDSAIKINGDTTIKYEIDNFVIKYKDAIGINYRINDKIKKLSMTISGDYELSENNTAVYLISKSPNIMFDDDKIYINDSNVKKMILLTSFSDLKFDNYNNINKNLTAVYDDYLQSKLKIFTNKIVYIVLGIIVALLVLIIIIRFIFKKSKIKVNGKVDLNAEYYDDIPFDKDLYRIYFFADYFDLMKNKSSLIGMMIFKFIIEGKIKCVDNNYQLKKEVKFNNKLDEFLYEILISASNNNMVFDKKMLRTYIINNKDRILRWYKKVEDYNYSFLKRVHHKYVIDESLVNETNKLVGLKKYLRYFNQVPRKGRLTLEIYKYLICLSILFGISTSFANEIIRKNKDNIYANVLLNYDKKLYNDIYRIINEK